MATTFYELESAWWQWAEENNPEATGKERFKWASSRPFSYDETTWHRVSSSMKSNSRKTTYWRVSFVGDDGRKLDDGQPLNRNNDPKRNWGLGRD